LRLLLRFRRDQDFPLGRIGPRAQQFAQRQRRRQCGLAIAASDRKHADVDARREGSGYELRLVGRELDRLTSEASGRHLERLDEPGREGRRVSHFGPCV